MSQTSNVYCKCQPPGLFPSAEGYDFRQGTAMTAAAATVSNFTTHFQVQIKYSQTPELRDQVRLIPRDTPFDLKACKFTPLAVLDKFRKGILRRFYVFPRQFSCFRVGCPNIKLTERKLEKRRPTIDRRTKYHRYGAYTKSIGKSFRKTDLFEIFLQNLKTLKNTFVLTHFRQRLFHGGKTDSGTFLKNTRTSFLTQN